MESLQPESAVGEAQRVMNICNACRYCERAPEYISEDKTY